MTPQALPPQSFDACDTTQPLSPAAYMAPAEPECRQNVQQQDTIRKGWQTMSPEYGRTTHRLRTVEAPSRSPRNDAVDELIKDTAYEYNRVYAHEREEQKALNKGPAPAKKVNLNLSHEQTYGQSGIDRATLMTFDNLNLDLRTMTRQDREKVYAHPLLTDEERKLPISAAVAMLKVKLCDLRADIIDKEGPRPVAYNDIPQTKQAYTPAPQQDQPKKKKGWLSRKASAVGSAVKKLKFWGKK